MLKTSTDAKLKILTPNEYIQLNKQKLQTYKTINKMLSPQTKTRNYTKQYTLISFDPIN